MTLPNFIFAGAAKSGSSTLFEYIRQHPDIYMSEVKEPFFFDFNYKKGLSHYETFFTNYQGETIIGEATVWYMSWQSATQRIYETIPNTKLLFVLRNPIQRAFSNYLMDLRGGHYTPHQTFGYVIRNEQKISKLNRRIVSGGFYYQHLKRFEEYFPRKNMLILLYDELKQDIRAVEKRIYQFLEVDPNFQAEVHKNYMVAPYLPNQQLLTQYSRYLPGFNQAWSRYRHFRNLFLDYNSKNKNRMSDEDRDYLREVYSQENQLLGDYIGVNLKHWN